MKEAEEKLKKMQDTMKRKYTCDRSITVTRLEDLLQDAAVRQPSRSSEDVSLRRKLLLLLFKCLLFASFAILIFSG